MIPKLYTDDEPEYFWTLDNKYKADYNMRRLMYQGFCGMKDGLMSLCGPDSIFSRFESPDDYADPGTGWYEKLRIRLKLRGSGLAVPYHKRPKPLYYDPDSLIMPRDEYGAELVSRIGERDYRLYRRANACRLWMASCISGRKGPLGEVEFKEYKDCVLKTEKELRDRDDHLRRRSEAFAKRLGYRLHPWTHDDALREIGTVDIVEHRPDFHPGIEGAMYMAVILDDGDVAIYGVFGNDGFSVGDRTYIIDNRPVKMR